MAEFVTEHLAYQYRRDIDLAGRATTFTWCAQWWRHEEAVSRLTGLWRAWENLRTDPTTGTGRVVARLRRPHHARPLRRKGTLPRLHPQGTQSPRGYRFRWTLRQPASLTDPHTDSEPEVTEGHIALP